MTKNLLMVGDPAADKKLGNLVRVLRKSGWSVELVVDGMDLFIKLNKNVDQLTAIVSSAEFMLVTATVVGAYRMRENSPGSFPLVIYWSTVPGLKLAIDSIFMATSCVLSSEAEIVKLLTQ